jgi:hypothetical protein
VALVLFVIGIRDRRRANEERRQADDDRLRDQARRIWMSTEGLVTSTRDEKVVYRLYCAISNTSDEAIINCRIGLLTEPRTQVAAYEPTYGIVLPNTRHADGYMEQDSPFVPEDAPPPPLQLIFTDAAGVQWWRNTDGNLEL